MLLAGAAVLTVATDLHADRRWEVHMYLDGDNNLEQQIIGDLEEAEAADKNDEQAAITAQLDVRHGKAYRSAPAGGQTQRFVVTRPVQAIPMKHEDMGIVGSLANALRWSATSKPAMYRALVVASHGSGVRALGGDGYSTGPASPEGRALLRDQRSGNELGVEQFAGALALATEKLQVLGLDACLMATLEVAYALRDRVEFLVASEDVEPIAGWQHKTWATALAGPAGATVDSRGLALSFLQSFKDSIQENQDRRNATLAILTMSRVQATADQFRAFTRKMNDAWPSIKTDVLSARSFCPDLGDEIRANTVDLGCFATMLAPRVREKAAAVAAAADDLVERICGARNYAEPCRSDALVVDRYLRDALGLNHGVSIYFPKNQLLAGEGVKFSSYVSPDTGLTFVRDFPEWVTFLANFLSASETLGEPR